MSGRPVTPDGGNREAEHIAGLESILGCLVSAVVAVLATALWLLLNANWPFAK